MIEIIRRYEEDKGYEQVRFSNPPDPGHLTGEFKIIQRPKIPELEGFVEHYLRLNQSQERGCYHAFKHTHGQDGV